MFVCCECCVLSGRGLCDGLITRPEGSYRMWCVVVCDLETSRMRRPWPALGRSATGNKKKVCKLKNTRRHINLTFLVVRNHITWYSITTIQMHLFHLTEAKHSLENVS